MSFMIYFVVILNRPYCNLLDSPNYVFCHCQLYYHWTPGQWAVECGVMIWRRIVQKKCKMVKKISRNKIYSACILKYLSNFWATKFIVVKVLMWKGLVPRQKTHLHLRNWNPELCKRLFAQPWRMKVFSVLFFVNMYSSN